MDRRRGRDGTVPRDDARRGGGRRARDDSPRLEEGLLRLLDRPAAVAGIALGAYALFLGLFLAAHGWDASLFVVAGDRYCDPARVPSNLTVLRDSDGYDGQFYYRTALDPFSNRLLNHGILVDNDAYRHQRILLPLLAWALSLGREHLVPWTILAVNLAGIAALGGLGAVLARRVGRHALWGLAIPLAPNFLLTFRRDLTEILASAFLLGAVILLRDRRAAAATGALLLAVLARETTLFFAFACGAVWLLQAVGRLSRVQPEEEGAFVPPPFVLLAPVLFYGAFQILLHRVWGSWAWTDHPSIFVFPFQGIVHALQHPDPLRFNEDVRIYLLEISFFAAFVATVLLRLRGRGIAPPVERIALGAYLLLAFLFNEFSWIHDYGFLRQNGEMFLLGWILLLEGRAPIRWGFVLTGSTIWIALADLWIRR